jgi:N-acetylmuramoyl-L-alanine amidase
MKRSVTLMMMTALLASVPAWAAPPFGSFGGQVGGGNSGAGVMALTGWALDDDGVNAVDILVDGVVVGRANYHRNRPEVAKRYPGYPDSIAAGYAYTLDTTHFLNGNHKISVRVQSKTGEVANLPGKVVQFLNVQHNLVPFGKIEFPTSQAELRGKCTSLVRRWNVISGYALDAGVQDYDTGVGYVELLIDRSLWYNSRLHCIFNAGLGGYSDCYGLRRLDIQPIFPGLKDAPHSGFRFLIDIGDLVSRGFYTEGQHVLTIRAGDHAGQVSLIGEVPVTFLCDENLGNEEGIGAIDNPGFGQQLSGFTYVSGWALDFEGIGLVQVLIDGIVVGPAETGLSYPFISSLYVGYPQSAAPGWRLLIDTRNYSNGPHQIELLVTDVKGVSTYIGKRQFIVNNP